MYVRFRPVRALALVTSLWWAFGTSPVHAGTATGTLNVSMTVTTACTIDSTATLAFGSVTGASLAATDGTGSATFSVTCTNGAPFAIGMGAGSNVSGTQRRMAASGPLYLNYGLYQTNDTSTPWTTADTSTACTTDGDCVLSTGTGAPVSYTVYGDVPSGQAPSAATYSDSVTMTVVY